MGTSYSVACRTCKVHRDLDKFYSMMDAPLRKDALELSEYIKSHDNYRAALLASFMWEHRGHNCTVFYEHDEALSDELDPVFNKDIKSDDRDFWKA